MVRKLYYVHSWLNNVERFNLFSIQVFTLSNVYLSDLKLVIKHISF